MNEETHEKHTKYTQDSMFPNFGQKKQKIARLYVANCH